LMLALVVTALPYTLRPSAERRTLAA
jgi:hypothetical protein